MQIIDIGKCVNNIDPKGIGRIRYYPYGQFTSEIERGANYNEWDDNDPFVALPFLPLHINIVPQIEQSVKLIRYDTDKKTQNVEYIGGPYTSPHDIQNQTFSSQHKDTTYGGVIVKSVKDIRNQDGSFNSPVTKGTIVGPKDTGFRGNYGSDVIFTENGIQLRGGMLLNKQSKKSNVLDYPQMAKKMGRFTLKKFSKTYQAVKDTVDNSKVAISQLKYIVEYDINSLTSPTELRLFVYKVVGGYGKEFNTDVFGENTVFPTDDTTIVKLINTGNTLTDATYVVPLNGTIQSAYIELRLLLNLIGDQNLKKLDLSYPNEDIHPFYFRPTSNFKLTRGSNSTEAANKTTFLSKIEVRTKSGGSSLIFSRQSATPPLIENKKIGMVSREVKGAGEQSFSCLSADKVYITSTSPNVGKNIKTINFNDLDEYELTQDDYVAKIEPNTYALVRGEVLYDMIIAIINLINSHIHNVNETLVKTDPNWNILMELANSLRDDLLNNSLRIN